jgi:hypothetical protein
LRRSDQISAEKLVISAAIPTIAAASRTIILPSPLIAPRLFSPAWLAVGQQKVRHVLVLE